MPFPRETFLTNRSCWIFTVNSQIFANYTPSAFSEVETRSSSTPRLFSILSMPLLSKKKLSLKT